MGIYYYLACERCKEITEVYKNDPGDDGDRIYAGNLANFLPRHVGCDLYFLDDGLCEDEYYDKYMHYTKIRARDDEIDSENENEEGKMPESETKDEELKILSKVQCQMQSDIQELRRDMNESWREGRDERISLRARLDKYHRVLGEFGEADSLPAALKEFYEKVDANAIGVQNVYDKFMELEERQKSIEEILNGDKVKELIAKIPTTEEIIKMHKMIEDSSVEELKKHIEQTKNYLSELLYKFTG